MSTTDPFEDLGRVLAEIVRRAVADALDAAGRAQRPDNVEMVPIAEAARRLALGSTTVKRLIASGDLRSCLVGRRRLIAIDALTEYTAKVAS